MREQHLDFLSTATGLHVFRRCGARTGYVAGVFMQIPRDLAGKSVRAALWFESAGVAIQFAGAIESCSFRSDAASWGCVGAPKLDQFLARRARVTVAFGIEREVGAGECAVSSVGLVEDRDVRGNVLLFDQPCQAVTLSAVKNAGFMPKRVSVRSSIVRAAPTSACRMARVASTSTITPWSVSIR